MTLSDFATADILVDSNATGMTVQGMTLAGARWIHDNVVENPSRYPGRQVAVLPAEVPDIITSARKAGYRVVAS